MLKKIITLLLLSMSVADAVAQTEVGGTVADSLSGAPLRNANVTVMHGGKPSRFTRTAADGTFRVKAQTGDKLTVTYMGYRKKTVPAFADKAILIALAPETFVLKEIQVKGGRIFGRQDTISYDIGSFADKRDNSLKDVLKKLPGVDVDKDGTVSFNGKAVNRFTVEDLDLTGGRYNKLNETLKAKDVDKAEVIEHDQPVKALQGKVFTDNVAMNIKLKPEARDKWMLTLRPAVAVGFPLHKTEPFGAADALQIGKKRQRMYDAEYDCSGRDVTESNSVLALGGTTGYGEGTKLPSWFAVQSLASPIDEERLRFNRSHNESVKNVWKTKNGGDSRITAGYMHTNERQETADKTLYYFDTEQPQQTSETGTAVMRNDRLYVDFTHNTNTEKAYGNEYFLAEGTQADCASVLDGSGTGRVSQRVKVPELHASNTFNRIWVRGRQSVEVKSVVDFHHSQSSLNVNGTEEKMKNTMYYTKEDAILTLTQRLLTHRYKASVTAEHLDVRGGNTHLALSAAPYWEYKPGKATVVLNVPVNWDIFTRQGERHLNVSPSLYSNVKITGRSELTATVGYGSASSGWGNFVLAEYNSDYRTRVITDGIVPRTGTLYASMEYEYKRAIKEMFWKASVNYNRTWYNTMTDMTIADGRYLLHTLARNSQGTVVTAGTLLSKGFFDLHLKVRMGIDYTFAEGSQLSGGSVYGYKSNTVAASPELTFSPDFGTFAYSGRFSLNAMSTSGTAAESLLNWMQRVSYTQSIGNVDVTLKAVHYRNEIQGGNTAGTLLADASVVWRMKKVRLSAEMRNIFNKRHYTETVYSGVSSSTRYYILRPGEVIVSAQISL